MTTEFKCEPEHFNERIFVSIYHDINWRKTRKQRKLYFERSQIYSVCSKIHESLETTAPRCQRVEHLGSALEDWLSKRRQYEMFTDRNGRLCQASDDSIVAAMFRLMPNSLEETYVRQRRGLPGVAGQNAGLRQHEAADPNE